MASSLPEKQRALVLENIGADFQLKTVQTPQPTPGSAVIQVLAVGVLSYHREVYNGERHYKPPTPLVGGCSSIGRVVACGQDSIALREGDLVYTDCVIRGRDDPDALFVLGIHEGQNERTQRLSHGAWRDGPFAEHVRVPLENCMRLDEAQLCGHLGYTIHELMYIWYLLVPFGGLRSIGLEPGETVVVSPATGGYGGAAVLVAIAMGARVIAMGRNKTELARLKAHVFNGSPNANIETMQMTGNEMADAEMLRTFGTIDAGIDFSPPGAKKSPHLGSIVRSLRRGGRVSLMGSNELTVVPMFLIARDLTLKGKLMYEREDMVLFLKMFEAGLFPRGKDLVDVKAFPLKDWKAALDAGAEHIGIGKTVLMIP